MNISNIKYEIFTFSLPIVCVFSLHALEDVFKTNSYHFQERDVIYGLDLKV